MACISPTYVNENKVFVACGKCGFCLREKRNAWTFRIKTEMNHSTSAWFITMTYSEENVNKAPIYDPATGEQTDGFVKTVKKDDWQKFMKRLRKKQEALSDRQLRYYTISEYSPAPKYRPHWHTILFNLDRKLVPRIVDIWAKGHVKILPVKVGAIHYVTEYHITKDRRNHEEVEKYCPDYERPDTYMSRKPAIGYQYIRDNWKKHVGKDAPFYVINDGYAMPMPKYYRDKLKPNLKQLNDVGLISHASYIRQKEDEKNRNLIRKIEAHKKEIERVKKYSNDPEWHIEYSNHYHNNRILTKATKGKL